MACQMVRATVLTSVSAYAVTHGGVSMTTHAAGIPRVLAIASGKGSVRAFGLLARGYREEVLGTP